MLGQQFGKLTVIADAGSDKYGNSLLECLCSCGKTTKVSRVRLHGVHGTQSCGCLKVDATKISNTTHGLCYAPEYEVWSGMKSRCLNPKDVSYKNYGGRGIAVCDRWLNSFADFHQDMGPRPSTNHSIERMDNALGYNAANCIWSTSADQANNRRSNILLTINGLTKNVAIWAIELGLNPHLIYSRLKRGWPAEKALTATSGSVRSRHRLVTFNGKTMSVTAWGRESGISRMTIFSRLRNGWTMERALTQKLRKW